MNALTNNAHWTQTLSADARKKARWGDPARLIQRGRPDYLPLLMPMSTGGGADVCLEAQEARVRAAMARMRAEKTAFILDSFEWIWRLCFAASEFSRCCNGYSVEQGACQEEFGTERGSGLVKRSAVKASTVMGDSAHSPIHTGVPTATTSYNSATSTFRSRMQPWLARWPICGSPLVPWM